MIYSGQGLLFHQVYRYFRLYTADPLLIKAWVSSIRSLRLLMIIDHDDYFIGLCIRVRDAACPDLHDADMFQDVGDDNHSCRYACCVSLIPIHLIAFFLKLSRYWYTVTNYFNPVVLVSSGLV